MPILCIIFILQLTCSYPAYAFWNPFKKTQVARNYTELLLNEEVLINSKYRSVDGIFHIKLAINIPSDAEDLKITSFVDEMNELQIENVNWIVEQRPDKKKTHKLFQPRIVKAYKSEKLIDSKAEVMHIDYDPDKAYDRISDDKHMIVRTFYFTRADIFGENKERVANFLELSFNDGLKKSIRIEEKLYQEPINITDGIFPNQDLYGDSNPYLKYEERMAQEKALEAKSQQSLDMIKKMNHEQNNAGYNPMEYSSMPAGVMPVNESGVRDFYTDQSPEGIMIDQQLMNIFDSESIEEDFGF
jgi:hypothetical protein